MKRLTYFLLVVLIFAACKKSNNSGDVNPPMVSISSPANLATFTSGQNIPIKASITENDELESIHLNIEGPDFIHYAYTGSGKSQSISEDIPLSIKGKYTVSIEAHDKAGNHGLAKVEIIIN